MDDALFEEMFRVEARHWWFRAKHRIVEALLDRHLLVNRHRPKVVDLGCGCGMLLKRLAARYECIGVDGFQQAVDFCAQRGIAVVKGGLPEPLPLPGKSFDAALLLDVLEHLDDDQGTVHAARRLLRPGGIVIACSPAYRWLWSGRDDAHHHRRRYTLTRFRALFENSGLTIQTASYMNTLLFPLAVAERVYRKLFPLGGSGGDLKVPPEILNRAMEATFAAERHLIGTFSLPYGLSVICIARND